MPYAASASFNLPTTPGQIVWHYIKTKYFLRLLERREISFRSAREFDDSLEASLPYSRIEKPIVDSDDGEALINQIADWMIQYSSRVEYQQNYSFLNYAHCWTTREAECMAMWKLYVNAIPSNSGVALFTSVERLCGAFDPAPETVNIGLVSYHDLCDPLFCPPAPVVPALLKYEPCSYEKELRAITCPINRENCPNFDDHPRRYSVTVNLADLIQGIVVAPRSTDGFVETVRTTIASSGLNANIVRRSVLDCIPLRTQVSV